MTDQTEKHFKLFMERYIEFTNNPNDIITLSNLYNHYWSWYWSLRKITISCSLFVTCLNHYLPKLYDNYAQTLRRYKIVPFPESQLMQ